METSVTIPVNTKAEVFLPAASSGHDYLIVDGESVEAVRDGNYLKVELGSGVHTVSLPIAAKLTASVETSSPLFVGEEGKLILNAVDANGESVSFDGAQISYSSSDETVATVAEEDVYKRQPWTTRRNTLSSPSAYPVMRSTSLN